MADPILVDAHMHITESREKGRVRKQTYEIWEYGPKSDVRYSPHDGDLGGGMARRTRVQPPSLDLGTAAGYSHALSTATGRDRVGSSVRSPDIHTR